MAPQQSVKSAAMRALGARCVFQPFPHHHCKIASCNYSACVPRRTPDTPFWPAALAAARPLNGTKMRAGALLTRLDVPFRLVADGVP